MGRDVKVPDDMVPRVARVIADGVRDDMPSDEIARAAIAAMREPTPQMLGAASCIPHARDAEIYRAMIAAALRR